MKDIAEETPASLGNGVFVRWRELPVVVRLLFIFSLVACAFHFGTFISRELREYLIQWIGWGDLVINAVPAIFIVAYLSGASKRRSRLRWLPYVMAAFAIYGLIQYFIDVRRPQSFTEANPYLRVHPWRPLSTVALPAAWALLIFVPRSSRRWLADPGR